MLAQHIVDWGRRQRVLSACKMGQGLTPHPPTPFKSVRSFILAKMSSKKAPRLWPRSFLRHSERYLRHFAACKSTSMRYLRGFEAPRGSGPRFLVSGTLSRHPGRTPLFK